MIRSQLKGLILSALLLPVTAATQRAHAALPTDFADQLVVSGLSQPSGFAFLPDGRMLIVEQKTQRVRLVLAGGATADTTLTLTDVNTSGNERGLLGIAIDPGWPAQPHVYLYFDQTPSIKVWIVRYTATGDLSNGASSNLALGDRYVILNDIPDAASNHNGGGLRFGPDGMLYASLGEDADPCGAQDSTTFKGVILRMNVAALPSGPGGPPARSLITPVDNPFTGGNANAGLVWAFGLRNPFRFHIDPPTGTLFIADVGQDTFEEINECGSAGQNFGWPYYEGSATLGGVCPPQGPYTPPIATFSHSGFGSLSIISVGQYRRIPGGAYTFPADYEGDYLYAEYYSGIIRRIRKSGSWSPVAAAPGQPNATDWGTATTFVSEWVAGPDGALYYCKQFSNPSIRRVVYTGPQPPGIATGLSATAVSASRIDLAWTAATGSVDFYDVESRIPPAAFALRATVNGATTALADTGLSPQTVYEYRVSARNGAGTWGYSDTARDTTLIQSGVGDTPGPKPARLSVFPNPFRAGGSGVTVQLSNVDTGRADLRVFDVAGREVRRLEPGRADDSGRLNWDGTGNDGRRLPSGVYFLRMTAGTQSATTRIVLTER